MKTLVISAFPACGKSYATDKLIKKGYKVLDSDSRQFSQIKDINGNKVRNPNFIKDYIKHIKDNISLVDIIFVSSHKDVRQALKDEDINYAMVIPRITCKNSWIGRCWLRGNDNNFIKLLNDNWENWLLEIINEKPFDMICYLDDNEYIMDIINVLNTCIKN